METLNACPICSSPALHAHISCVDFTVSKERFVVAKCDGCGFRLTNPRPSESEIGRYYQSEEYVSHSNTSKGAVNFLYQQVRKRALRSKLALVNSLSPKGSLLDIGSGTGHFLSTCKADNWTALGIEPDPKARQFATENFGLDAREESALPTLPDRGFEVITMWHVLEHVHRLNERVDELKRLLKPGGRIVIAVPNCSSLDAEIYSEFWAAWDVPRHLYHFTPADIENLFSRHGMQVERLLPMPYDSYYVSMLSEKYKTGKVNMARAFLNGWKSNRAAAKTGKTYSSQIYIIKA